VTVIVRKWIVPIVALMVSTPALTAAPGSALNFLDRAERLKAKGPLAFFDSDYSRLKAEGTAAGVSIRNDRIAAERARRPILYCSPSPRAELGNFEFIRALEAIPRAELAQMSLKEAMLRVLQKKYPCRS
jgi:hypothetical protein